MRFDVFTLFPEVLKPYLETSILQRAHTGGLLAVYLHQIRHYARDRHRMTDDEPYGGGGGMVMKPEPLFHAVEAILGAPPAAPVVLLTPQGRPLTQAVAGELAGLPHLALVCGRYEGVDERVRQNLVSDEISIGDFVITGGELAALVVIDAVARLLPGVLGDPKAPHKDSYAGGLLEGPHYTRPAAFRNWDVPDVLRSGDHGKVARWRREAALRRTWERRPDLLDKADLSPAERRFLEDLEAGD